MANKRKSTFKFRNHPGNIPLIVITALGFILGGWKGAVVMFIAFGVIYLMGAYNCK